MAVVLTGATGLIGSAVLRALLASGHEVTALVRSEASAQKVSTAGAHAVQGDLTDVAWVTEQFAAGDGAIHTASPGDASSADFDLGVAQAAIAAYAGSAKPYVHTGGAWVWGSADDITEASPFAPPQLTAWREGVENQLFGADLRVAVVAPGIVYGGPEDGLAAMITQPTESGEYRLIGDGSQHWTTVSADQVADLYVRAFDHPDASGYFLGVNDDQPTVREIVAAAGAGEPVAETADESRARLFPPLVDALLLDQQASNAKARRELGWNPVGPSLLEVVAGR